MKRFRACAILLFSSIVGMAGDAAPFDPDIKNYRDIKEFSDKYENILSKSTSPLEKAKEIIGVAQKIGKQRVIATACVIALGLVNEIENPQAVKEFHNILMSLNEKDPIVTGFQEEFRAFSDNLNKNIEEDKNIVEGVLSNESEYYRAGYVLARYRYMNDQAVIQIIKSLASDQLRIATTFTILNAVVLYGNKASIETPLIGVLKNSKLPGEYLVQYLQTLEKSTRPVDIIVISDVLAKIWGVDKKDITHEILADKQSRFAAALEGKGILYDYPVFSQKERDIQNTELEKNEATSKVLIARAIEIVQKSDLSFIRKGGNCLGMDIAMRMRLKYPILSKIPGVKTEEFTLLWYLTYDSREILGGISNHIKSEPYQVVLENGNKISLFSWLLVKLSLNDKEIERLKSQGYEYALTAGLKELMPKNDKK